MVSSAVRAPSTRAFLVVVGTHVTIVGVPDMIEVRRPALIDDAPAPSSPKQGSRCIPTTHSTQVNPSEVTKPLVGSEPHTHASSEVAL